LNDNSLSDGALLGREEQLFNKLNKRRLALKVGRHFIAS